MTDPGADSLSRLRSVGATALEYRLLEAAARDQPPAELTRRMASAIGIAGIPGVPSGGGGLGTGAAGGKLAAGTMWPWIAGGVLVLASAGALVATRSSRPSETSPGITPAAPITEPATAVAMAEPRTLAPPPAVVAPVVDSPAPSPAPRHRSVPTIEEGLRDQIAMIDEARAAMAAGSDERGLDLLRRYASKYPTGSFRPEATALRIEALTRLGRKAEARALGERFVAEHGASALADRVRRLLELP